MEFLLDGFQLFRVFNEPCSRQSQDLCAVDHRIVGRFGLAGIQILLRVSRRSLRDKGHADAGAGHMAHHVAEVGGTSLLAGRTDAGSMDLLGLLHHQLVESQHRDLVVEALFLDDLHFRLGHHGCALKYLPDAGHHAV